MKDEEYQCIKIVREESGSLVWIRLNRPKTLNAMSWELIEELHDILDRLMNDKIARVVILKGEGKGFCSGADLMASSYAVGGKKWNGADYLSQRFFSSIIKKIRDIPQPVIAAVHGAASGGGFSLALAADVRIAGETFKANAAYLKIGLSGAELGSSYFLPKYVGFNVANELLLTGKFIYAERALKVGLVSSVVKDEDLDQAARDHGKEMLRTSYKGLLMTKEQMNAAMDGQSLVGALAAEDGRQVVCLNDPGCQEFGKIAIKKIAKNPNAKL